MAIYHLSMRRVARTAGHCAARALAYLSRGERLRQPDGRTTPKWLCHDQTEIVDCGIIGWSGDRQSLADAAEACERRSDAVVGRGLTIGLPYELPEDARLHLARGYAAHIREAYGHVVGWAVHRPPQGGDNRNHHLHLWLSERPYNGETWSRKKPAYWTSKNQTIIPQLRMEWERRCNVALAKASSTSRVTAKSHAEAGIPLIPTVHVGVGATRMSRAGYPAQKITKNEDIINADTTIITALGDACSRAASSKRARSRSRRGRMGAGRERHVSAQVGYTSHPIHEAAADTCAGGMAGRGTGAHVSGDRIIGNMNAEQAKSVDLRQIASALGWVVDVAGGRGEHTQMRRPDGSHEIIIRRQADGHWTYYRRADGRGGSAIDLLRDAEGLGVGQALGRIGELVATGLPAPRTFSFSRLSSAAGSGAPEPRVIPPRSVVPAISGEEYLRSRCISRQTIEHFGRHVTLGPDAVSFRHSLAGGSGSEYRGQDKRGFSRGEKKGLWFSPAASRETRAIIVCESGIDALSHAQAHGLPDNTAYCSTGGGFGQSVLTVLVELARRFGAILVSAFDVDPAGERMSAQLCAAAHESGVPYRRDCPTRGKDWNEVISSHSSSAAEAVIEDKNYEETLSL